MPGRLTPAAAEELERMANSAEQGKIVRIKAPQWPDFRFEYHPKMGKTFYQFRNKIGTVLKEGVIDDHVSDFGDGFRSVQAFTRGMKLMGELLDKEK